LFVNARTEGDDPVDGAAWLREAPAGPPRGSWAARGFLAWP